MNRERTATSAALVVGGLAVGGFLLYTSTHNGQEYAPKIISLKPVSQTIRHPAGVEVTLQNSPAFVRWASAGIELWEYRIRDASGRMFLVTDGETNEGQKTLFFPSGYSKPVVDPRLEIWTDEERITSVSLPDFPPAETKTLIPDPHPKLRAFSIPTKTLVKQFGRLFRTLSAIRFEPIRPLENGEEWTIDILETPSAKGQFGTATELAGPVGETPMVTRQSVASNAEPVVNSLWVLRFPYAEEATMVKVRVKKWKHRTTTEEVTIPGLRLRHHDGQTVLLGPAQSIKNSLGLDLKLKSITFPKYPGGKPFPDAHSGMRDISVRVLSRPDESFWTPQFEIVSPRPETIGLLGLRFNVERIKEGLKLGVDWLPPVGLSASRDARKVPPIKTAFSVKLSVKKEWQQILGEFDTVVRVVPVP